MALIDFYKTVKEERVSEFTEKHSRFIAHIKNTVSEGEAEGFISDIKSKNKQAKHNVYAYLLRNNKSKISDDGEPHGTAGARVLEAIKQHELIDVTIVVTRYFGGVLLGTGGLSRAYQRAADLVIESGKISLMEQCVEGKIECDYKLSNKVTSLIYAKGGFIDECSYEERVFIVFHISLCNFSKLQSELLEVFSGELNLEFRNKFFEKQ